MLSCSLLETSELLALHQLILLPPMRVFYMGDVSLKYYLVMRAIFLPALQIIFPSIP
jgi:hypothetical protein